MAVLSFENRDQRVSSQRISEKAKRRISVPQNHLHGKGTANFRPLSGRCRLQNKPFLVYQNPDFTLHNPVFDKTTNTTAPLDGEIEPYLPPSTGGGRGAGGIGENPVYYGLFFELRQFALSFDGPVASRRRLMPPLSLLRLLRR